MAVFEKIIAFFMFLVSLFTGSVTIGKNPSDTSAVDNKIVFFSDFQGNDRETNLNAILDKVDFMPTLAICGGDYQSSFAGSGASAYGINLIKNYTQNKWDGSLQYIFVQGNHDPAGTEGLSSSGLYEFDKFFVYVVNEDDFPWNEKVTPTSKNTVIKTANAIDAALTQIENSGVEKPVFITSHLPLHKTTRSSGGDNMYASYIFDAINPHAKNLNIFFLFGHNHSGSYDDYIGGSVVMLNPGDEISVAGKSSADTLEFTYMDYGYVGYSNNTDSDTSTSALTITTAEIFPDRIEFQRYTSDGAYYDTAITVPLGSQTTLDAAA